MKETIEKLSNGLSSETPPRKFLKAVRAEKKRFDREEFLKTEGYRLVPKGKRTTLEVLKYILDGRPAKGEIADVATGLLELFQKYTMQSCSALCREVVQESWQYVLDENITLIIVQPVYVAGGFTPTLADEEEKDKYLKGGSNYLCRLQRVLGTAHFGTENLVKNSFVLVNGGSGLHKKLWVCKVLLFFRAKLLCMERTTDQEELAFVQYMECTKSIDEVEKSLGCVCLRGCITDKVEYRLMTGIAEEKVEVREWFGIEPFSSLEGIINVVRGGYALKPFSSPVHSAKQRFYIIRFYKAIREEIENVGLGVQTGNLRHENS